MDNDTYGDLQEFKRRAAVNIQGSALGRMIFLTHRLSVTTRNVILSTTEKSGPVIFLSAEDTKKIIDILEVMCEEV